MAYIETVIKEIHRYEYKKLEPKELDREKKLMTVSYMDGAPFIRIRGKWLEQAGFNIGDKYTVSIQENQLVLSRVEAQEIK